MGDNEIAGPPLDVRRMLNALNDHHVDYVVVGGIAALIHGATRATKDADIVVDGHTRNLQNLLRALSALRARARTETESGDYDNAGNAAAGRPRWHLDDVEHSFVSLQTAAGSLDVMPSLAGPNGRLTYQDLIADAATFSYAEDAVTIKVASLAHIIASKRSANRPKDLEALPELETLNQPADPEANNEHS